jgi:DNA-directed RNA polymerase specialized sigma24 family protein
MRKNWLAAARAHLFRARPLVPDAAFQSATEPHPGHWRRFPEPWPVALAGRSDVEARTTEPPAALAAALAGLPALWRRVVMAHAAARGGDEQVAKDFGLSLDQVRDILARARAAVRDGLDRARTGGPR